MKRLFALWVQFTKTSLIREIEFRTQFLFQMLTDLLYVGFIFFMAEVFFTNTQEIAGWSKNEVFLLIATWAMVHEFFNAVCYFGLNRLSELIRRGNLDPLLTHPLHIIWQLSFSRLSLSHVVQTAIHITLFSLFLSRANISLDPGSFFGFLFLCACGFLLLFSLHLFLQSLSFWFIHIDNIKFIYHSITEIARHPTAVFKTLQALFFTIIPIAYLGNIQTLFLLGKESSSVLFSTTLVTVISVSIALGTYTFGARSYTSASS